MSNPREDKGYFETGKRRRDDRDVKGNFCKNEGSTLAKLQKMTESFINNEHDPDPGRNSIEIKVDPNIFEQFYVEGDIPLVKEEEESPHLSSGSPPQVIGIVEVKVEEATDPFQDPLYVADPPLPFSNELEEGFKPPTPPIVKKTFDLLTPEYIKTNLNFKLIRPKPANYVPEIPTSKPANYVPEIPTSKPANYVPEIPTPKPANYVSEIPQKKKKSKKVCLPKSTKARVITKKLPPSKFIKRNLNLRVIRPKPTPIVPEVPQTTKKSKKVRSSPKARAPKPLPPPPPPPPTPEYIKTSLNFQLIRPKPTPIVPEVPQKTKKSKKMRSSTKARAAKPLPLPPPPSLEYVNLNFPLIRPKPANFVPDIPKEIKTVHSSNNCELLEQLVKGPIFVTEEPAKLLKQGLNITWRCPHCARTYANQWSLTEHVTNSHPFHFYKPELPPGVTEEQVENTIKGMISCGIFYSEDNLSFFSCLFCSGPIHYRQSYEIRNHMIKCHLDKVKERLTNAQI